MSARDYDALVVGGGSAGVACATALAAGGKHVALFERERVGGECAFWACVPSKVLLRSAQPNAESARVPGSDAARAGAAHFDRAAAWRTEMVSAYRDDEHAGFVRDAGVDLVRGDVRIVDPRTVALGDRSYTASTLVIATGSEPQIPPLDGLAGSPYWTSRDATAAADVPESLAILGGGAVGVELSQIFARYGSHVSLIEAAPSILAGEDPAAAALIAAALARDGVDVRAAAEVRHVGWHDGVVTLTFASGDPVSAKRLCVASGRTARTAGFGLEAAGVTLDHDGAIVVDATCRAAPGVYAVGDVTGAATFTHVAKYQARIAAAAILGTAVRARYDAVPRCVYSSPELAASGMTRKAAEDAGIDAIVARVDLDEVTRAAITYAEPATGAIELIADRAANRIVGGWIVAPGASEMIAFVSTAIRTAAPLETLLDVIQPYPTFSEGWYVALDRLARQRR